MLSFLAVVEGMGMVSNRAWDSAMIAVSLERIPVALKLAEAITIGWIVLASWSSQEELMFLGTSGTMLMVTGSSTIT